MRHHVQSCRFDDGAKTDSRGGGDGGRSWQGEERPNNRMGHRASAENDVLCHALTSEETTGLRAGKKRQASSDPRIATMPTVVHAA